MACLCGGKVRAFVKLNRIGFVPGEDIHLNADVSFFPDRYVCKAVCIDNGDVVRETTGDSLVKVIDTDIFLWQ